MVEQGLVGKDVEVVAVGDIVPADNLAYLLKYDSTQGRFDGHPAVEHLAGDFPRGVGERLQASGGWPLCRRPVEAWEGTRTP
jgi:hypothetical protein